jgi:hypothetical protein
LASFSNKRWANGGIVRIGDDEQRDRLKFQFTPDLVAVALEGGDVDVWKTDFNVCALLQYKREGRGVIGLD